MSDPVLTKIVDILFPPDEKRDDGSWVDHSSDGNLESAIIDLERRGTDPVCLHTLHKVLEQLSAARAAWEVYSQ